MRAFLALSLSIDEEADGPTNMARDVDLLAEAENGTSKCRLYRWNGPWVSLGRFQHAKEAVAPGFSAFVQRPTGGKAVLHGHDWTVAIATPFAGRSVKEAYRRATGPLIAALNRCGMSCGLAGNRDLGAVSEDCFATASPYDLIDQESGKKVVGAAMRLNRGAILLQASVPCQNPLINPAFAIIGAQQTELSDWEWRRFPWALEKELCG